MAKSQDFLFRTNRESLEIENHTITIESDTEATFKWSTNNAADTQLIVVPYRNGVRSLDEVQIFSQDDFTTIHELNVTVLEAGVLYDIELQSEDESGNIANRSIPGFSTALPG